MIFATSAYLISAVICIESAFSVFLKNRSSPLFIKYFILCIDFAICSIALCHIVSAPYISYCYLWYYINIPFGCILSTLMLDFVITLTCYTLTKKKLFVIVLYIIPACFASVMITAGYFGSVFFRTGLGWETALILSSRWTFLFIIYFFTPSVLSLVIFFYWKVKVKDENLRLLARKLSLPVIAGTAGIFLCPYFWHFTGYNKINMAMDLSGQILFIWFIIGARIPLKKYRSAKITPETSTGELITSFRNPVFVVMKGGKIVSYNKSAEKLIDVRAVEEHESIYDIFDCPETVKSIIKQIEEGHADRSIIRCSISAGRDGRTSFSLEIEPIKNENGEFAGVMVFVKEDRTIGEFKKKYRITDRQLDILFMTVSGLSNREIASCLKISEKTVENHLFNIYNRVGVDNKIELFNLTRSIDIVPH